MYLYFLCLILSYQIITLTKRVINIILVLPASFPKLHHIGNITKAKKGYELDKTIPESKASPMLFVESFNHSHIFYFS